MRELNHKNTVCLSCNHVISIDAVEIYGLSSKELKIKVLNAPIKYIKCPYLCHSNGKLSDVSICAFSHKVLTIDKEVVLSCGHKIDLNCKSIENAKESMMCVICQNDVSIPRCKMTNRVITTSNMLKYSCGHFIYQDINVNNHIYCPVENCIGKYIDPNVVEIEDDINENKNAIPPKIKEKIKILLKKSDKICKKCQKLVKGNHKFIKTIKENGDWYREYKCVNKIL